MTRRSLLALGLANVACVIGACAHAAYFVITRTQEPGATGHKANWRFWMQIFENDQLPFWLLALAVLFGAWVLVLFRTRRLERAR